VAIVVVTTVKAAEVAAIRTNPRAALAVDGPGMPPRSLLVRGSPVVEIVDGVSDEHVAASGKVLPVEASPARKPAATRSARRWRSTVPRLSPTSSPLEG
jgi:hypothetical protein